MRLHRLRRPATGGQGLSSVVIGTAGWSIPSTLGEQFPGEGAHLDRYARVLSGAEINSSFHRPHRRSTYERWAMATPPGFRFAVKLPKTISHVRRLVGADDLLDAFLGEIVGLGDKLAVLLVQLPPSFAFDRAVADRFFAELGARTAAAIACEPRHASWFGDEADACLFTHRVARVAADPVLVIGGDSPGGWPGLRYHRLHGSPRIYYSAYDEAFIAALATRLRHEDPPTWCVFDTTASGAATANALALHTALTA